MQLSAPSRTEPCSVFVRTPVLLLSIQETWRVLLCPALTYHAKAVIPRLPKKRGSICRHL